MVGLMAFAHNFLIYRPHNIVFSDDKSVINVCLCVHHENPARMIESSILSSEMKFKAVISEDFEHNLEPLDFAQKLICEDDNEACWLRTCNVCKSDKSDNLKFELKEIFEEINIFNVAYELFVHTDRTNLEVKNESYTSFIDQFVKLLEKLLPHHFVAVRQQRYFEHLKKNLPLNSVICATDFSENYMLEENFQVQSAWFGRGQVTILPFVLYLNRNGSFEQKSVIFISDSLNHSAKEVYAYIHTLQEFISRDYEEIGHCYYFSDGAGGSAYDLSLHPPQYL